MKIVVLNGSPRPKGNTDAMISAFQEGAKNAGHEIKRFDVCKMNIKGCLACEYCHTKEFRYCIQKDDMTEIYSALDEAEMLVLASPIYYHSLSGQLQTVINRIYSLGYPKKLKKAMLFLSSGDKGVYDGAKFIYQNSFIGFLHLEDMGIYTAAGDENKSKELLDTLKKVGENLMEPNEKNIPKLVIKAGNITLKADLNTTIAARDFMNRLPLSVKGFDSGVDFCCQLESGVVDESEMQYGWKNGDINLSDGWFAILYGGEEQSKSYHQMIIAHLDEESKKLIKELPKNTSFELSLEEPYRNHDI